MTLAPLRCCSLNRSHWASAIGLCVVICCLNGVQGAEQVQPAPPKALSSSSVGVSAQLAQMVIAGSELEAKPIDDRQAPLVVRVVATYPHGTDFRYDFEYYGLEPGRYDLRDFLQRKDHSPLTSAQPLPVEIITRLPAGQLLPSDLATKKLPYVGGYRDALFAGAILWLLVLFWLVGGRRRLAMAANGKVRPPSPAERLRPLVVEAVAGRLTPEGQAELERVLLSYWRQRLGLEQADPVLALATVRAHPEAGALLRLIEDWLHRPGGAAEVDVAAILAPYQHVSDVADLPSAATLSGMRHVAEPAGLAASTSNRGT